jgi:hypothetical protein
MEKTIFELAALGLCPLILVVSVWITAIKALTWTDEISEVVRALTRSDEKAERTTVGADVLSSQNGRSDYARHE